MSKNASVDTYHKTWQRTILRTGNWSTLMEFSHHQRASLIVISKSVISETCKNVIQHHECLCGETLQNCVLLLWDTQKTQCWNAPEWRHQETYPLWLPVVNNFIGPWCRSDRTLKGTHTMMSAVNVHSCSPLCPCCAALFFVLLPLFSFQYCIVRRWLKIQSNHVLSLFPPQHKEQFGWDKMSREPVLRRIV